MKVRQICMMVLFGLGVIPAMQAQTFDKLWKEVEQAEKKSLPKTVIKLTDEIYQKGEKERNSAQMLKAYMWRMKTQARLTPDSSYLCRFKRLGAMGEADKTADGSRHITLFDSGILCQLCRRQPVATPAKNRDCR